MTDQQRQRQVPKERATYLTLVGLFLGVFAAFWKHEQDESSPLKVDLLDLLMLGLATFRVGRLAAYDRVSEPIRASITETTEDEYGAGENVIAAGSGVRKAFGELVSCPTCVGTWVSAGLVYGLRLAPRPTRLFLGFMSAMGLAELLDNASEALSWTGQARRKESAPE